MIHLFLHRVAHSSLSLSHQATESVLQGVKLLVNGSLHGTGGGLQALSHAFFFRPEWKAGLLRAGILVRDTSVRTDEALQVAIQETNQAFDKALFAVQASTKQTDDFFFDNRVIASIMGSAHDQKFSFTKISLSFRDVGKDITPEQAWDQFLTSGKRAQILFVPGLLTDETVWIEKWIPYKKKKIRAKGIATELEKKNYHPFFLRYNHGLPIHENGIKLAHFLEHFALAHAEFTPHVICYSLGCLVFRSALYFADQQKMTWHKKIQKVVFLASPNRGSYLEKIGFWLGNLLERTPNLALKVLGLIGNLRSDAIKDLSFGFIRKEPSSFWSPITRYFQDPYHGELDSIDAYEAYSLLDTVQNPIQNFLGDGIVEKQSLTYLTERVFQKKENPSTRTLEIPKANHFSILQRKELFAWLDGIYPDRTST